MPGTSRARKWHAGQRTRLLLSGLMLPAIVCAADAARCRLSKGLYEDRLAIVRKQGPASGSLPALEATAPITKLGTIDEQYRQFLTELADASESKNVEAIKACCDEASGDRLASLFCQLSSYINNGRTESSQFLDLFPNGKKDSNMLWDMDALAGDLRYVLFPPKGAGYRMIDELFLLVMDERDVAISKYFSLASHASGEVSSYMDGQIRIFLKEAPSTVVNQWLSLRRYRPKLRAAAQSLISSSSPAEMQKVVKAVQTFCDNSNPDCPDILKLYSGK